MSAKAPGNDFPGRHREIISDPLNLLIRRKPEAGFTSGDRVTLHNGISVAYTGSNAYYGDFSSILVLNRGVHEPLEEFVFQEVVATLGAEPRMLELGAYWGHYSMWLKLQRPRAEVMLVEPEPANLEVGKENFRHNGFQGTFTQGFVGTGHFEVDPQMDQAQWPCLDILHADIQGYEMEMLASAQRAIEERRIARIFVSTHSQELHRDCIAFLAKRDYRIEVEADFDTGTTSFDGFIYASSPAIAPVLEGLKPMPRVQINQASPALLLEYLAQVRKIQRQWRNKPLTTS